MTHRPETRARAVLAQLDPWLKRVESGPDHGDIDLRGARSRLLVSLERVRSVSVGGGLPDLKPDTTQSDDSRRHAAIDALLTVARSANAPGISPEEVEKKATEISQLEDAAMRDALAFMWDLGSRTTIRYPPPPSSAEPARPSPPGPRPREVWAACVSETLDPEHAEVM